MDIQLVEYIGQIKNDTGKLGKAFLFNILDDYSFDCILFIHDDIQFVSLHKDEINNNKDKNEILKNILNKYTLQILRDYDNK